MLKAWKRGAKPVLCVMGLFALITEGAGVSGVDLLAVIVLPYLVGRAGE